MAEFERAHEVLTGNLWNLVIAFAVIAQVLINRKQWQSMRDALAQGREALRVSERAYVGVSSIEMDKKRKAVLVKIENTGNMPAERITLFLRLSSFTPVEFTEDREPVQHVKTSSVREDYGRTKLFRGNLPIMLSFYLRKWTDEEFRLIEDDVFGLVLSGYVSYSDGFTDRAEERTEFFFNYQSEIGSWSAGPADYGGMLGYQDEDDQNPN